MLEGGEKGVFYQKKELLICPPFSLRIEYEDHYINITYLIKIKLGGLLYSELSNFIVLKHVLL
jgi:hypothetical protein